MCVTIEMYLCGLWCMMKASILYEYMLYPFDFNGPKASMLQNINEIVIQVSLYESTSCMFVCWWCRLYDYVQAEKIRCYRRRECAIIS